MMNSEQITEKVKLLKNANKDILIKVAKSTKIPENRYSDIEQALVFTLMKKYQINLEELEKMKKLRRQITQRKYKKSEKGRIRNRVLSLEWYHRNKNKNKNDGESAAKLVF